SFDSNTSRLYFNDGSFWAMNAQSSGNEGDAGTLYPTLMQDWNGNNLAIHYAAGIGISGVDSSARITSIEDPRGSHTFTYNTDAIPHLTGIGNNINTAEAYSFSYGSQTLTTPPSPFSGTFGTATVLQTLSVTGLSISHGFGYAGTGEMTQLTTPLGGVL